MSKLNLPLTMTGERIEFQRLYDLTGTAGRNMTTSGTYSFTSLSSGLIYSTSTGGEYNVFLQLQTALLSFNLDDADINNLSDEITVLSGTSGNYEKTNLSAFNALVTDLTYPTATGTATAITLTLPNLVNGYSKTFVASANNSGSATTINTKPLYRPNTTTAPTLIAGKAYTVWYSISGSCFFIKASAEGNTVPAHVLALDTFSNDTDTGLIGTMPNNPSPASTLTTQGATKVVPLGYNPGGTITVSLPDNGLQSATLTTNGATKVIPAGYTGLGGIVTVSIPNKSTQTYTPGTTNQTITSGQFLSGDQIILGDADILAANILSGKSIFEVVGNAPNTTVNSSTPSGGYDGDYWIQP